MFQKKMFLFYVFLIALLMLPMGASADDEIQLAKTFTSFTPVFMNGHEGDMDWIEGFTGTGDIYQGATEMGTVTFADTYEYVQMKMVNTITGMGTFEVNGIALSLNSSTFPTDYNTTLSWTGSISNGTGSLSSLVGLSAGTFQVNMATFAATGTELILYRLGY